MNNAVTLRRLGTGDEELMVQLRVEFLEAMGHVTGENAVPLEEHLRAYVGSAMASGSLVAWAAEADTAGVVSNGWIVIIQKPPHGNNLSGLEGYIVNVHTKPEWRGMGLASLVMERLIAEGREAKAGLIKLIASSDGRSVYERLGFEQVEGAMKLNL